MLKRSGKVAVIGSDGIPNRYGGFETLAFELHSRSEDFVIISSSYKRKRDSRINSRNIYLPFPSNGWSNTIYDSVSLIIALLRYKNILVLGSTLSPVLIIASFFSSITLNIGGIDWKRRKWGRLVSLFLRLAESYSILFSKNLICDNKFIGKYIESEYKRPSSFIPYGIPSDIKQSLEQQDYFLSILRIQQDNNVDLVLDAFSNGTRRLVIVGNWEVSNYSKKLRERYQHNKNIEMRDAVYDPRIIENLRSNCFAYVHPHSAGGTNPSLVEMLPFNKPILAYSNGFNEETLLGEGYFWSNSEELEYLISQGNDLKPVIFEKEFREVYDWPSITSKYLEQCQR